MKTETEYNLQPNICNHCTHIINYKLYVNAKGNPKFCNKSCSASFNNKKRKHTIKTKLRIAETIYCHYANTLTVRSTKQHYIPKSFIIGPFTKIYYCKCRHCGNNFLSKRNIMYCNTHKHIYTNEARNRYEFSFNIDKLSFLFSNYQEYLSKGIGSYKNPEGLNRDHKVSVIDAIKHQYDPYYITHPLNCELLSWIDNNKKKHKSSLAYQTLIQLVDDYEINNIIQIPV